jgi:hypothetical protein
MPQFFMMHVPTDFVSNRDELQFDQKYMCRARGDCFFIRCEVELPLCGSDEPLGFIVWVQVAEAVYAEYRSYRENEDTLPRYKELVSGHLANPIPEVPGSFGVAVKFKVLPKDPTPYIRWAQPSSQLASRMEHGVTAEFWHKVVSLFS